MNAIIHHGLKNRYSISIRAESALFADTALNYTWEETQNGIEEILGRENQLEAFNKAGARLRSSMVGDVFELPDNRFYVVNSSGFVQITKAQFEKYALLPEHEVYLGWNWVKSRYFIESVAQ